MVRPPNYQRSPWTCTCGSRRFARKLNEVSGGFGFLRLSDRILLPQSFRLIGATKRVERIGSDTSAVLGPGVVPCRGLRARCRGQACRCTRRLSRKYRHPQSDRAPTRYTTHTVRRAALNSSSRYGAMTPFVEIIFAIGLSVGFALGYAVRAFMSHRRRQAARRRRIFQ